MLAGGLQIFGLSFGMACAVAVPLTLVLAGLVWWRLDAELSGDSPPPF
jgi:hypothetical protein